MPKIFRKLIGGNTGNLLWASDYRDTYNMFSDKMAADCWAYFTLNDNSKAGVMEQFVHTYGNWTQFNQLYPNDTAQYKFCGPNYYVTLPNTGGNYTNKQVYDMLWTHQNSDCNQFTDGHYETFADWFATGENGDSIPVKL
jgi:hypothetical protein